MTTADPKRILVVDDEPDIALLCRLNLEAAGFAVEEASDGVAALERARRHRPDAIVLDVMLPELDGVGVLRELRSDPTTAAIPVVMLTAKSHERTRVAAFALGAAAFVTKPFEPLALVDAVRGALSPGAAAEQERGRVDAVDGLRAREADAAARLAAVVESADDAIITKTLDGVITSWNKGAHRIYGYEPEEVLGQPISILVPADHLDEVPEILARIRRGDRVDHYETVRLRKDGTAIDVSLTVSPVVDAAGRVIAASVIARDVTERRHAEARFRALLEAAPDAVIIVAAGDRIQLVNAQTERLFGYSRDELAGRGVDVLIPDYAATTTSREELRAVRKDGSEFPVELSVSRVEAAVDQLVFVAVRDVTERRRTQRAVAEALEREREAARTLRELNRMKSDFISTISHELRTPLTSIKGFADTLLHQWDAVPDDTRRDLISRISVAGAKLDGLIADLLDVTRLERGTLEVDLQRHDVADLIERVVAKAGPIRETHRVDVVGDSAGVMADAVAFTRALDNLLSNAAKFSPAGSRILVETAEADGEVVVRVSDEGIGVTPEDAARVFERFYRGAGKATKPGTGVGLAIVKEFVEAQRGRVWVEPRDGRGTTFAIALQRAD